MVVRVAECVRRYRYTFTVVRIVDDVKGKQPFGGGLEARAGCVNVEIAASLLTEATTPSARGICFKTFTIYKVKTGSSAIGQRLSS